MQALAWNFSDKRREVDGVDANIESSVHDAFLVAKDNLVIHKVELLIRSVNASSARNLTSVVYDTDQEDFWGHTRGLQMTT